MRAPPTDRSLQLVLTALFTLALLILILWFSACNSQRVQQRTFSRPKFEVETIKTPKSGRAAVRQTWYKRYWFWQRERMKYDERMREHGPRGDVPVMERDVALVPQRDSRLRGSDFVAEKDTVQ